MPPKKVKKEDDMSLSPGEINELLKGIKSIAKSIDKHTEVQVELVKELKILNANNSNKVELSLNTRLNDDSVFVTRIPIEKITEQTVVDNFGLLLKSLGHVLLIAKEDEEENKEKK